MLSPDSELKAVRLEGVSPVDQASMQADRLQGVDLTEYYGGRDFGSAERVILNQLKYSHRHPDVAWTAARLAEKGSRGQPGVVRRLAEAFEAFSDGSEREEVLGRLQIRLVSNQPLQPKLSKLMTAVKVLLGEHPGPLDAKRLLKSLPDSDATELRRLYVAANLPSRRFTDFLRVFDLDHLGSGERWEQEARIAEALGAHLLEGTATAGRELFDLVRREALPEATDSLGLTREDLLARLNVSGEDALFPMPSRIEVPGKVIPTPDQTALRDAIMSREEGWVIAYGDAGVGKTTTVASLESCLPNGSVVVTYDCFGAGEYLSPTETRHRPEAALMEIINEISLRCGSGLLVEPPRMPYLLWKRLENVLESASATVSNLDGRFVLAIDAIDNAVVAGRERKEQTFVDDLLRLGLPSGVTILLSCRTHRMDGLHVSSPPCKVEMHGFDEHATAECLRRRFPTADDEVCRQFHERSGGNPRSQFYLLDTESPDQVVSPAEAVMRAHRTPDSYFDDLLKEALRLSPDIDTGNRRIAELISLSRPVAMATLAGVAGTDLDSAHRFCRALVPGVRLAEDETLEFRDEDFEVFLRGKVSKDAAREANARISEYLWARRNDEADAAMQVAQHLALSGRRQELMSLALQEGQPSVISDPVARLQTYYRRLTLAMQVAEDKVHREEAFMLTLLAAQAARTDQAVAAIVRSRPDLAMRFGDRRAVAEIYEAAHREPWRGPMHLRAAAVDAERQDRRGAEEQLRLAEAWLRVWSSKEPDERRSWEISAEDVATGARAVYLLRGSAAALEEMGRWRPLGFVLESAEILVRQLARIESGTRVCNQMAKLGLSPAIEGRLQAALFADGQTVPSVHLRRTVRAVLGDPPSRQRLRESWTIDYLELVAFVDPPSLEGALDLMGPQAPEGIAFDRTLREWGPVLRLHALGAATTGVDPDPEDLLPDDLRGDREEDPKDRRAEERRAEQRRELMKIFTRFLPAYHVRARGLVGRLSTAALTASLEPELKGYEEAAANRWHEGDHSYRNWACIVAEAAARTSRGDASGFLGRVADLAPTVTAFSGTAVWIGVSRPLLWRKRTRDLAYRLLDRAAVTIEGSEEPASEKADQMLAIAGLLEPKEESLAADYYGRAVRAAEGLDVEGAGVLEVNAALAMQARSADHSKNAATAERLARSVERFRPFVADSDELPWARTAGSVASLDPASGMALLNRWEEENICPISSSIPPVLEACQDAGFLSAEESLVLLGLAEDHAYSTTATVNFLEVLRSDSGDSRRRLECALETLADFVELQLLPESRLRVARALKRWIDEQRLTSMPAASGLIALADFSERLYSEETSSTSSYPTHASRSERRQAKRRLVDGANGSVEEISTGLAALAGDFAGDDEIEEFLANVQARISPQDRVAALRTLAELDVDGRLWRGHGAVFLRAIGRWTSAWGQADPVKKWAGASLPTILRDHFLALVAYPEYAERSVAAALALPFLEDPGGLVIEALGPNLPQLGARKLHAIARGLVPALTNDQRLAVLNWSLGVLENGEVPPTPTLPDDGPNALALLLWALFGNPDKRLRWRGAHLGRELLKIAKGPLCDALVELLTAKEAGAFATATDTFFWMSAQVWLLVLLARYADESPSSLESHLDRLAELTLDGDWPHATTRELARRTTLRLDRHTSSLSRETRDKVLAANRPRSCWAERGNSFADGHRAEYEGKFRFDAMDTLPYWFAPLARVFKMDPGEIASRAGAWIVERLGFSQERIEGLREPRDRRYEYDEVSNRQGGYPRVETLRLYLEYHAMLLTAGELIGEGAPILWENYQDAEDPWSSWLSRDLDASPGWWSSDLRSPVTLVPESYGVLGPLSQWRQVSTEDFDRELGLTGNSIVVAASTEVSNRDAYGHVYVTSALVTPRTSGALMRALQTCRDPMDFGLPDEDRIWPADNEIDHGEFRLWGWLSERRHYEVGLEEQDPWRRITLSFTAPGSKFIEARGLKVERDGRRLLDRDGELVGATQSWSDQPLLSRGHNARASYSEGWRSTVRLEDLIAFLSDQKADLIIAVRLQRQFSVGTGIDDEERYERGKSRIYLLRLDGTIEVVAGRGPSRRTDRRRAGP